METCDRQGQHAIEQNALEVGRYGMQLTSWLMQVVSNMRLDCKQVWNGIARCAR